MCPAWSPCEHQLTPALSPIRGPASEATPSAEGYLQSSQEAIYSLNDAPHISPNVFSYRNFLSNIHVLFQHTFTVIHTNYASHSSNIYILLLRDNRPVTSSIPPGRPTALGLLYPTQVELDVYEHIQSYSIVLLNFRGTMKVFLEFVAQFREMFCKILLNWNLLLTNFVYSKYRIS